MSAEVEKQGTFLVDTKSTCFFCLEEIPPKSPPIIDLDDEEEGVATMLLEEMNRSRAGVSMEKIFKYLDIDPGAILRRQLTGGLEWAASQLMNTNIKVSVCEECERVTDSLTDMIEELEVLQKRIFNGVGRLEEVLKVSLEDPVREAVFRGKLTTPVDILQGSIADVMRKASAEKCVEYLYKPSHPQVPVASPPTPPQVASPAPAFVSSTTTPSPPPSSGNVKLLNDDVVAKLVVQAKYKCGICDLAVSSMNSLQDHTRKKHNLRVISASTNPSLACHTCGMELPSKEDWSNHTHQQCQAHLISTQTPPTTFSGDPHFKPHFKCSDCEDEFPTLERFEKHIQLFCKHRPSSSSTAAPPPKRSRPSNSAGKYPCPVCHSVFAHSPSLARHRRSSPRCSLNPQNSEPVPILVSTFSLAESPPVPAATETNNNAKFECEYCGNVLSCSSALGRHRRQNCVKFRKLISQQQENGQSTGYVLSPQDFEGEDDWNDVDMVVEQLDDVEVEHIVVKQEGADEILILPN